MAIQLAWILLVYGLAAAVVRLLYIRHATELLTGHQKRPDQRRIHYILITSNHELWVEWVIRVLTVYSYLLGRHLRISVIDDQSEDHTVRILERLGRRGGFELAVISSPLSVEPSTMEAEAGEARAVLDLRTMKPTDKIPFVR
ncbi:hypothetical protein OIN60_17890 [Paenibacillus sp. P96]|uniref:Glycosyltransferase n=1 Tax=Paenibacillus zeirhizosphaerae TaxID=2987519 RepID=A0ABT9FVV1_9BACL|nr:hypothetical protein [Paenibacillus sp. P96]MDP4098607.1 hypothetical protein [Paenibacillus sp. P96]